jgi:hypothetical protein
MYVIGEKRGSHSAPLYAARICFVLVSPSVMLVPRAARYILSCGSVPDGRTTAHARRED